MNKKVIGIILSGVMLASTLSACAAPASKPSTGAPANQPGTVVPTIAPDVGGAAVAPSAPTNQGAVAGVTTPGAAPNPAFAVPGGGYTSPTPTYNQYQSQSGIMVTGQGQVQATPDIATLYLGVTSQQSTVAAAQTAAASAMNAVMQVLKGKGIADADIQTVGFNINPVYDYRSNTPVITGYQVSNQITVKIRKISDVSSIIDSSVTAGGNLITVNSISFGVNDPTPYLKQARAAAMNDAKTKAAELATLGGVRVGLPTFITESSGYYPPSPIYYASGVAAAKDVATPISPGQSEINVSVTVVYGIQ